MIAAIFPWILIIILLLPDSEVNISNKYFRWCYSRQELLDNISLTKDRRDL